MFPATNRPRGSVLENTARLHADAKKTNCHSSAKVQTCMCRYTNGNLNVRFSSWSNAQFDICIKGMCDVLQKKLKEKKTKKTKNKTAELIIEINFRAPTRGILKYWLEWGRKINAGLIKLDDRRFVSFAYHLWKGDRQATVTQQRFVFTNKVRWEATRVENLEDKTGYQPKKPCVLHPVSHIFLSEEQG